MGMCKEIRQHQQQNKRLLSRMVAVVLSTFILITAVDMTQVMASASVVDYSDESNWAILPENPDKCVDTFFVAPTASNSDTFLMDMLDQKSRKSFLGASMMEKGIYDDETNFYAPYYSQITLEAYGLSEEEREPYLVSAYHDVELAFSYYMETYNQGRPIILAGFSQGADLVKRLLINHPEIQDKLVAAYIIGWNLTEEELQAYPHLKMAKGADDTGVIISFCSEAASLNTSIIVPNKTYGINPLNWKTDGTIAVKEENAGACFTDYSGEIVSEIPNLCGAYLDPTRGTLKVIDITPTEYPAILSFLEEGNYHIYDYQFFYRNLEENVQNRIQTYLEE